MLSKVQFGTPAAGKCCEARVSQKVGEVNEAGVEMGKWTEALWRGQRGILNRGNTGMRKPRMAECSGREKPGILAARGRKDRKRKD